SPLHALRNLLKGLLPSVRFSVSSIQDPLHDTLQGTVQSPLHDLLGGSAQGSVQGPLHGRHWSRPRAWPTARLSARVRFNTLGTARFRHWSKGPLHDPLRGDPQRGALRGSAHGSLRDPLLAARHWSKGPLPNPLPRRRSARPLRGALRGSAQGST